MNSTLLAVIITLGVFAIAGLFALFEALGDRRKWLKREEAERSRTIVLYDPNNPTHFHLDRGDAQERSSRGTVIFALVWLAIAVTTIVLLLSVNHELKRMLYDATAPLRSAINPSQN